LIGRQIRVRGAHGGITRRAAIDPDAVRLHDRLGRRRQISDGGEVDALFLEGVAAAGTDRIRQSDLNRWGGPLRGGRQGAEGEVSSSGLATRRFGMGLALAFGEGGGGPLRVASLLFQLGL